MSEYEEEKNEFQKSLDDVMKMSMNFSDRVLKILDSEIHNSQKLATTVYDMTKSLKAMGDTKKDMNAVASDMLVFTTKTMAIKMFKWTEEEVEDFVSQYNVLADYISGEE